jgi:radical SAM superfamily enzyme YgiQ (UPF0313 family)
MSNFNKVLLVASGLLPVEKPPAALAFLAGVCDQHSVDYEIFDLNIFIKQHLGVDGWNNAYSLLPILDKPENKLVLDKIINIINIAVDQILTYNADLLAITLFSYQQILITQIFLETVKKQSSMKIIAGGPGISYIINDTKTVGKNFLDKNLVDFYILGEGDYVLQEFIRGNNVLGLNSKEFKTETWAPQIDDLDSCPLPTYKKINFDNYTPGINLTHIISITGSRGCVRRCTFCDVGTIWKKFRYRSASNIISEIVKHVKETNVKQFMFTDSLINGSIKQFIDLMTQLKELKYNRPEFRDIKYRGQFIIRPRGQHSEKMYQLMQQSGCDNIQIGIESGSNSVRTHMGKKFTNDDIYYHLDMCSKYQIKNAFLMMTGYPTETLEDHQQTVDFIKKCQKYLLDETVISLTLNSPYVLLKNTPIDTMKHELGIVNEHYTTHFFDIESNPESTVKERFRRYIELKKLSVNLKYPGSWAELDSLKVHINDIEAFNKEKTHVN